MNEEIYDNLAYLSPEEVREILIEVLEQLTEDVPSEYSHGLFKLRDALQRTIV